QAEPTITTLDNRPAEILVGDRVPIRVIDVSTASGGNAPPRATVRFEQTGINLKVTPHVTANRQVLMEVHAENSAVKPSSVDIGFTFQTQQADNQILVSDGETAVIGGLTVTTSADTQQIGSGLQFAVTASDNLSLKDIQLTYSGGYIAQTDTVFTQATTTFNQAVNITFPANSGAGGFIKIVGRATDGASNFASDSITIFLSNVQALTVTLLQPVPPAVASSGKNIPVQVAARQLGGIATLGFIITPRNAVVDPTTPPTDSLVFTPPARQPPDTIYSDTLAVQNGFTSFTVTAFAVDAGGRRALSPPVTVTVQTPGNDLTPPAVSHSISSRVEVNDNVTVHATDPSGISWIGFRVDTALNAAPPFTGIVALKIDTVNVSAGNLTTVDSTFALALPLGDSALPKSVVVRGYACDLATARNCAYSQTSTVITGTAARPRALGIGALSGSGVDTVIV